MIWHRATDWTKIYNCLSATQHNATQCNVLTILSEHHCEECLVKKIKIKLGSTDKGNRDWSLGGAFPKSTLPCSKEYPWIAKCLRKADSLPSKYKQSLARSASLHPQKEECLHLKVARPTSSLFRDKFQYGALRGRYIKYLRMYEIVLEK